MDKDLIPVRTSRGTPDLSHLLLLSVHRCVKRVKGMTLQRLISGQWEPQLGGPGAFTRVSKHAVAHTRNNTFREC